MRHRRLLPAVSLGVLTLAALAACGGNTATGPAPAADLSGTYGLVSITFQGNPAIGPPTATGRLVLTKTTYNVTLDIKPPLVPEQVIVDSGTYSISGNAWSQSSLVNPVQSVGTYTLSHDTLTVNVTTVGMQVENVWKKQ